MSTALDGPLRGVATLLTELLGPKATITRTIKGVYDPATGVQGEDTVRTYAATACPPETFRFDQASNTAVQQGDLVLHVAAANLAIVPSQDTDSLTLDSTVYDILGVVPIMSGKQVALYQLSCRN